MSIDEIESAWRETGIMCPAGCGWMTFSDGKHRPTCGNEKCLAEVTDEQIWMWLITDHGQESAEQFGGHYFESTRPEPFG